MKTNRITYILGIKYPIVQAPMSWLTSAELVASVSNAGGLGVLGVNAGQSTVTTSVEETTQRMRQEIRKVKQLTDKPFGLNILFAQDMSFSAPLIDLALEEKVPVLAGVTVDNTDFSKMIKDLKSKGLKIMLRPAVPTIENCRQAEKNGADILVVTGFDSGGLAPTSQIGTFSIVPMIADVVNLPILAAGGIGDVRGVRASMALGAEGVYVGTAFMGATENPLSPKIKEKMLNIGGADLHTFRSSLGFFRSVPTALSAELVAMNESGASLEEVRQKQNSTKTTISGLISGDYENDYINAGLSVSFIKEIRPAQEIVEDLMQDFI